MGAAAAVVLHLGCTPGLFIIGIFGILVLWMYANFWFTGTLFIVGVNCLLRWCDNLSGKPLHEDSKKTEETIIKEDYSGEFEYPSVPGEEETEKKVHMNKSSAKPTTPLAVVNSVKEISSFKIVKIETSSADVNMVGLEKTTQRSNSSRFPWDLDVEVMDEDEEEFEIWLQQALASGLLCETSKHRKSWSPFKLSQGKSKKQWRRTSI